MQEVLAKIVSDPRYQSNLDWGKARRGHPEGTVRAHIAELEENLEKVKSKISSEYYWKLKVLIHTHDSFKAEAVQGVPIEHPQSHASLARQFLAEFTQDNDLLNMVQYHDEGYALWCQYRRDKHYNSSRLQKLMQTIQDWDLFLIFCIIDACTKGKDPRPIQWFVQEMQGKVKTYVNQNWILPCD